MAWDPVWEKIFREKDWGRYPAESVIRFVARNFYKTPNRSDVRLLDVGCGAGANTWFMAREGFTVYGIDGSKTAIEKASAYLKKDLSEQSSERMGGGNLIVGDMEELPFEDNFFDGIVDARAITCNDVESSQRIYHELARVSKPKGKLYSSMFAEGIWGLTESGLATSGPLQNAGYKRLTHYDDIESLMPDWNVLSIDQLAYTLDGFKAEHWFKEFIVIAEKR